MGKTTTQPPAERKQKKKRKWDGSACNQGTPVLDAAIWHKLPSDIHMKLLEHLPLPALLRFQLVSKGWYSAIRNMDQVTVHGDCYAAVVQSQSTFRRVYSSRHEKILDAPVPQWGHYRVHNGTTRDGLLYFDNDDGSCTKLYNLFTGRTATIPSPPRAEGQKKACVMGSDGAGVFNIIRVVGESMLVYQSRLGAWVTSRLQLPPGEEFSMAPGLHSHAVIDGSILYFLTFNLRTQEVSAIRWIDFKRNVDGTSSKLLSWPSLPSSYVLYQFEENYYEQTHPFGRPFMGNIAAAGGKLFVACLRAIDPATPEACTVALLACDKQGKKIDFVSEMPLTDGFLPWDWKGDYVELHSQGDMLVVTYGVEYNFSCLYNTSTNSWSPFRFCSGDSLIYGVCPLRLSMRS